MEKAKQIPKTKWTTRFRYTIDQQFSRHPSVLILWLGILSILIIITIGIILYLSGLAPGGEPPYNLPEALWIGFLHTIEGGSLGGRESLWTFRFLMLGLMLFNLFFVSIVIGALTSGMQTRLEELKRGRTPVVENNHTIILGWSERIFTILSELVRAHAEQPSQSVVILSQLEKTTMEDEIRHKVGKTGKVRIVCRTGNPLEMTNLDLVSINTSRNILILPPDSSNPDAEVIKIVLAILNRPNRRAEPYRIIATVRDPRNAEIARMLGKNEVEWIQQGDVISRMIAQTTLQPGLSAVYSDLFDYTGSEIYLRAEPMLVGKTFGEALSASELVCVIGLRPAGEKPRLAPDMDTLIAPGDELIVIAPDDSNVIFGQHYLPVVYADSIYMSKRELPDSTRTILLGWNLRGPSILKELDRFVPPGSTIQVIADPALSDLNALQSCANLANLEITYQPGDSTDRLLLEGLNLGQYRHVILLAYSEKLAAQEADARTLITLLHLRDIADNTSLRFSIVTEMLDIRNRKLASSARPDDFIISDRMISLLMAQVAETRGLCMVYDDLFNPEGAELYLRPASLYVRAGSKLNFYTLIEAARQINEVAIGYRIIDRAEQLGSGDGLVLNPAKTPEFTLDADDQVIVLAHS